MKKHIITFVTILIGLTFTSFMTNDSILLRLRPQVGKTMTYQSKSSQIINMHLQGQSMTTSQNIEMKIDMNTTKVTTDSIFCEAQMKSIKMTQNAMGMTMTYDSEHPENASPMLADAMKTYQKLINKKIQIVTDQLGNAIKLPSENLPHFSAVYPEEPVKVGSTWTSDFTQDLSGNEMTMTMTYTVSKITKKETTISLEGVVKSNIGSGNSSGTMVIDNATGLTKSSTIKNTISLTISEQGLSIPATITSTTTLTLE